MAHYAFLDSNNVVTEVIPGRDEGADGIDWEQAYGEVRNQVCKQTSYNTCAGQHLRGGIPFRKNYAGIGYTYDAQRDAFIAPQPFASWVLDEETCVWDAPAPMPIDGNRYIWDETTFNWVRYAE
jgi:hypothetical protein